MPHRFANLFEKVWVLSMERSADRLQQFFQELPQPWPFRQPEVYRAVDGQNVPPPPSFPANSGTWGAFRSHYRMLEDALNARLESLLVFEDDAIFVPNFLQHAERFIDALPEDWDCIYFGGQHIEKDLGLPTPVNEHVYHPFNVHRLHAYALRNRKTIELLYEHLNSPDNWKWGNCVDHRFGELHKNFQGGVYVPAEWLVGQRGGFSTIQGRNLPTKFFPSAKWLCHAPVTHPMVIVTGECETQTNLVAAALHVLGIKMGGEEGDGSDAAQLVRSVSPGLHQVLTKLYDESLWNERTSYGHRVAHLRGWAGRRCRQNRGQSVQIGGSHRLFTIMAEELHEAWNRPTVIRVLGPAAPEATQRGHEVVRRRRVREGLERYSRLDFAKIMDLRLDVSQSPEQVLQHLCTELELAPSPEESWRALQILKSAVGAPMRSDA